MTMLRPPARAVQECAASMPSPTQRWGADKEALAEARLAAEGYEVIARNWRGGGGEIDRIAWDGDILCFVEVRARSTSSFGPPAATIDRRKQRLLIRAAAAYLSATRLRPRPMARFDVVSVIDTGHSEASVLIIRNAFDAGWR